MKNVLCALVVLAAVTAFAQPRPTVYENKDFAVTFYIPEGWTLVTDDAARQAYIDAAQIHSPQQLLVLMTRQVGDAPADRISLVATQFPRGTLLTGHTAETYVENWVSEHAYLHPLPDSSSYGAPMPGSVVKRFKTTTSPERSIELHAIAHRLSFFRVLGEFSSEAAMLDAEPYIVVGIRTKPDWENAHEKIAAEPGKLPDIVRIDRRENQRMLVHTQQPAYPPEARREGAQGTVVLRAIINTQGSVAELRVASGDPRLVPSAIEAVKQWRYKPYDLNGHLVNVEAAIAVNYALRR